MALENTSFKTRARTIDHLGREQIADCPTAISELWKNAYDAYSRSVELHIFDAPVNGIPVAALYDNGHGMSKQEFIDKWLVVGTESKVDDRLELLKIEDRNGLASRIRQGQKGIGRLSCAVMGHLLLLISKRKSSNFVACLIDWRLFENPYLLLSDIEMPIVEFESKNEIITYLPELFNSLMSNVWGVVGEKLSDAQKQRNQRIIAAWIAFDELEKNENKNSTKKAIESTIIETSFEPRHFENWDVWNGKFSHGTALLISQISDDLLSQLSLESINNEDALTIKTKNKFFETLSNFVDPFTRTIDGNGIDDFQTAVVAWNGLNRKEVIDSFAQFNIKNLDQLEHFVEGNVDENGVFRGSIRVLSKDFLNIVIPPREPISVNTSSQVGPFKIRLGAFEGKKENTSLTAEQRDDFDEKAEKYGGFMLHRDGFRIMPYGREDNDYFEIEKRRTIHAGDNFFSARRMFGGVKITRNGNPNLKDKAGREGLIDNKPAKQFKLIVSNLLQDLGNKYFGTKSENRKDLLGKQKKENLEKKKREEDQKKLINIQRKVLRNKIKENFERLILVSNQLENVSEYLAKLDHIESKEQAISLQKQISDLSGEAKELNIGLPSVSLGSLENDFNEYTRQHRKILSMLNQASNSINIVLEKIIKDSPEEVFKAESDRKKNLIEKRLLKWRSDAQNELSQESTRLNELFKERTIAYLQAVEGIHTQVKTGYLKLAEALGRLDEIYHDISQENENIFPPYIGALQSLRDQIDLQGLTTYSLKESNALREEISRIHALAQLGIAVEVIGHEIEDLDLTIERGLNDMPEATKNTKQFEQVLTAHHSLSDKWRFLSPLKLSGEKIYRDISGLDIYEYLNDFFRDFVSRSDIDFKATDEFKKFSVNELPSKLYPVFVNLFNNARYWVRHSKEQKKLILLDYRDGKMIVADNGPGVDVDDLSQLFTLFFTRKASGGRGVGLYLCRANLSAGGHLIQYETEENKKILTGANFSIEFRGSSNDKR